MLPVNTSPVHSSSNFIIHSFYGDSRVFSNNIFHLIQCLVFPIISSSSSWVCSFSCTIWICGFISFKSKIFVLKCALHSFLQQRQYIDSVLCLFFWYLNPLWMRTFPPRLPTITLVTILQTPLKLHSQLYIYTQTRLTFYTDIRCVSCLTDICLVFFADVRCVSHLVDMCLVFYTDIRCVSPLTDICLVFYTDIMCVRRLVDMCFVFYTDIRCVSCLTGTYFVIYTEIRCVSCLTDTYLVFYTDIRCVNRLVDTSCFLYWYQMCKPPERYMSCFLYWYQMC
jgi:hypothetical protein